MCLFLHSEVYLKELTYTSIYINGEIDGIRDLRIGSGVDIQLGEMVSFWAQLFKANDVIS